MIEVKVKGNCKNLEKSVQDFIKNIEKEKAQRCANEIRTTK